MSKAGMWTILVPHIKNGFELHQKFDDYVIDIAGGLSVLMPTIKGKWQSKQKDLFIERMIPVNVYCTKEQMKSIVGFAAKHYNQKAICYWLAAEEVFIEEFENATEKM